MSGSGLSANAVAAMVPTGAALPAPSSSSSATTMEQIMQNVREILGAQRGRGRADAGDVVAKGALIQKHRQGWESARERESDDVFSLATVLHALTHPSAAPAASAAPLSSLRSILISELKVKERHVGRVLYGRLLERPWKISAIQTLLEDEAGGLVKVEICHAVPPAAKMSAVEALYPKGLEVAIKEPYFELYGDRSVGVRVDNPADIVVLRGTRRSVDDHGVGGAQRSEAPALETLEGGSNATEQKAGLVGKQGGKPSKKKRAQQKKLKAAEDEEADKWLTEVCTEVEKVFKLCVEPGRLAAEPAGGSLADDHEDPECSVD